MFRKTIPFLLFLFWIMMPAISQPEGKRIIAGRLFNAQNNKPIPFAGIVIWRTTIG